MHAHTPCLIARNRVHATYKSICKLLDVFQPSCYVGKLLLVKRWWGTARAYTAATLPRLYHKTSNITDRK